MPTKAEAVRREHVEAFIEELLRIQKPATASNRYRALQQFFKFLEDEGEIERSPMTRSRPRPPFLLRTWRCSAADQKRLLVVACEGTDFESRRDAAIVRLFMDTGMRRAELTGLRSPISISPMMSPSSWGRAGGRACRSAGRHPSARSLPPSSSEAFVGKRRRALGSAVRGR